MEPLEWIVAIICIAPLVGFFSLVMPSFQKQPWYQKLSKKAKEGWIFTVNTLHYKTIWRWVNPKIIQTSKKRFETGHYADAIEAACKEINSVIQNIYLDKVGKELDGRELMLKAFSPEKPVITLADIHNKSGQSKQEGYMFLFAGTMSAFRNPVAHKNLDVSAVDTIKFIFLSSLLMDQLDEYINQPPIQN